MSGFRPEAVALTLRWAEIVLTGTAALWLLRETYLAYLNASPTSILTLVGAVFAGLWCAVTVMRFILRRRTVGPDRPGGPGIVTIQEGRIGYFGPEGGGFVALDALVQVDLIIGFEQASGLDWRFKDEFGQTLQIPAGAEGAEQIIDTIGVLSHVDYQSLLTAGFAKDPGIHPIWRREGGISLPGSSPANGS
ncbi:MAG: hypothetical protein AAGH74_05410 [Pseudomonadota bacterium]